MKLFIIVLAFGFFSHQLLAKKLYKYKDEQGLWHYSDKQPKTQQPVEVRQLKAANKRYLWLQKTGDKQKPEYFIINNYPAPVEVEVKLNQAKNVTSNPRLPKRFVIQPGQSDTLFQMTGTNQYKSWAYTLEYQYIVGSPLAEHDYDAVYLPPFAKNVSFAVSQAFGGKFSHTDKQNKFAVDIVMPVNTPVYAARTGTVIEVNNDFFQGGTKQAYKTRANSIRILHKDGSMAVYAHLALEKAQVYPGLKVFAGQIIAYSGNTGFSSGPHLHFAVQVNKGMELVSIPFQFMGTDGVANKPIAGKFLIN
jgi:murein DD-endopeptidase MepM/ murein hydrolase activator NlpD